MHVLSKRDKDVKQTILLHIHIVSYSHEVHLSALVRYNCEKFECRCVSSPPCRPRGGDVHLQVKTEVFTEDGAATCQNLPSKKLSKISNCCPLVGFAASTGVACVHARLAELVLALLHLEVQQDLVRSVNILERLRRIGGVVHVWNARAVH